MRTMEQLGMPKFKLFWEKTAYDDYGCDRIIITGTGILVVEASCREAVKQEVKKYTGVHTNYNEGIGIRRIEPCDQTEKAALFAAIGMLLDPWGTKQ